MKLRRESTSLIGQILAVNVLLVCSTLFAASAAAGEDRAGLCADDLDRVRVLLHASGAGEDLGRPDHVERLDAGVGQDHDPARLLPGAHRAIIAPTRSVRNVE